jgi:hypothetical protein
MLENNIKNKYWRLFMRIQCFTNLDLFNESWPEELPIMPVIGQQIESKTHHGDFHLSLEIVNIVWKYNEYNDEYYPRIELHDHFKRSIRKFYEWYAPLVDKRVSYFM